jgi:hypothetical protein
VSVCACVRECVCRCVVCVYVYVYVYVCVCVCVCCYTCVYMCVHMVVRSAHMICIIEIVRRQHICLCMLVRVGGGWIVDCVSVGWRKHKDLVFPPRDCEAVPKPNEDLSGALNPKP